VFGLRGTILLSRTGNLRWGGARAQGGVEAVQGEQIPEQFGEQKITPLQVRAWMASGQPLSLPGFLPHLLPHVQMGARYIHPLSPCYNAPYGSTSVSFLTHHAGLWKADLFWTMRRAYRIT